jgi:hypothetical protein
LTRDERILIIDAAVLEFALNRPARADDSYEGNPFEERAASLRIFLARIPEQHL